MKWNPLAPVLSAAAVFTALAVAGGQGRDAATPQVQIPIVRQAEATAKAVSDKIAAEVAALANLPPAERRAVLEAMHSVLREHLEALAPFAEDADLEVRLRAREVLADAVSETRLAAVLGALGSDQRKLLRQFCQGNRRTFESVLSAEGPNVLQAVFLSDRAAPPEGEPLLIAALLYGDEETAQWAAVIAGDGEYKSADLADALARVIALSAYRLPALSGRNFSGRLPSDGLSAAVTKLRAIGPQRVAPALAAAILKEKAGDLDAIVADAVLANLLVETQEKRAAGTLMKRLMEDAVIESAQAVAVRDDAESTATDSLVYAVVRLTQQDPDDYGIKTMAFPLATIAAFRDAVDRREAVEALRWWWLDDPAAKEYRELKPLDVPDFRQLLTGRRERAAGGVPAGHEGRRAEAMRRAIREVTEALAGVFRSDRPAHREAAQAALTAIPKAYVGILLDAGGKSDETPWSDLRHGLDRAASDAAISQAMLHLPERQRQMLLKCREVHTAAVEDIFSPCRVRSLAAVCDLADLNEGSDALEPLVLYCLGHPSQQIQAAALRAAQSGRFRGDVVVDFLADMLGSTARSVGWYAAFQGRLYGQPAPVQAEALRALAAIRAPRALTAIAEAMGKAQGFDMYRDALFCQTLLEINDRRVLDTLVPVLSSQSAAATRVTATVMDGKRVTMSTADAVLAVCLKLSGQNPKEYGMLSAERAVGSLGQRVTTYGFADDKARAAAIRKFQEYWNTYRQTEEYKKLQGPATSPAAK